MSWRRRASAVLLAVAILGPLAGSSARADEAVPPGAAVVDPGIQCVGDPPRQTFDPYAPACVPFWDAENDNGGDTALGVTTDEIRVVVYLPGSINHATGSDPANRTSPHDEIYDLAQPEDECRRQASHEDGCSHLVVRGLRVWQEYFNQRFQTYGRFVHLYAQFSGSSPTPTPERQRAELARALDAVDPFAVVTLGFGPAAQMTEYLDGAARAGRVAFSDASLLSEAALLGGDNAGRIWAWRASAEVLVDTYVSQVCRRVVDPTRRLAMIWTTSRYHPGLTVAAAGVREGVRACGGEIVDEATFEGCCLAHDTGDLPDEELRQMAQFHAQGVTTILWPGGFNANYPRAATAIGYDPDWVLLGDGMLDNPTAVFFAAAGPRFHRTAGVVTPRDVLRRGESRPCEVAFREFDATYPDQDLGYVCGHYRHLFLLHVAIQVAGAELSAATVEQGLSAIPARRPARDRALGSFGPTDHTFVDDVMAAWWDQNGTIEGDARPGCFRAVDDGRRWSAAETPHDPWGSRWGDDDPCDAATGPARLHLL